MSFVRPRGSPRVPGSGRTKGTPNRKSVAARELCSLLVENAQYQHRLRLDFMKRKLHPSIETLIWNYHLGKPKESIEMTGSLTVSQRLTAERDMVRAMLDPADIELLAIESQALLDRAIAAARAKRELTEGQGSTPQDVVVRAENVE